MGVPKNEWPRLELRPRQDKAHLCPLPGRCGNSWARANLEHPDKYKDTQGGCGCPGHIAQELNQALAQVFLFPVMFQ